MKDEYSRLAIIRTRRGTKNSFELWRVRIVGS